LVVVVVLMVAAASGCGGDNKPSPPTPAEIATFTRFCGLLAEFRASASTTGAAPTPSSFTGSQASFGALIEQLGPKLDELRASAPKDVAEPIGTIIDAVRKAKDGDTSGTQSASFTDSIQRADRFQQARCQTKMSDQVTP